MIHTFAIISIKPSRDNTDGHKALRYGNFIYKSVQSANENKIIIFNLPLADAKIIARNFKQERFLFGNLTKEIKSLACYKTSNAGKTYNIVENTDVITIEELLSKLEKDIPDIINQTEFIESMQEENTTFMSRSSHRKNSYKK